MNVIWDSDLNLISIILWGIVTAVINSDAPNADDINIFLLRESPVSLQSCSEEATRVTSATTSAASSHDVSTRATTERSEVLTDHLRERKRLVHLARVEITHGELLREQRAPHARKGRCNEKGDVSLN
jgi:hypothetical protein